MIVVEPKERDLDARVMQVFAEAIALAGGPRGLVEHRRLTWLPSLMEAAYAVVLHEEGKKSADEIAAFLGVSRQSVRNILAAPTERVRERLEHLGPGDEHGRVHVAGGLAKLAWRALRTKEEEGGGTVAGARGGERTGGD